MRSRDGEEGKCVERERVTVNNPQMESERPKRERATGRGHYGVCAYPVFPALSLFYSTLC